MIKHENNIKDMISKSGLKQTFIANRLGFHPADISHWISGRRLMNGVVCMDLAILLGCKRNDLYPKIYKDTNKYNHNALTISDILKVLEINYKPEAINLILDRYSLSLKSGICDYRFNRLRVKMKGVE